MRKLYTAKLINRPEMKFYLGPYYTLPSKWLKSTQAEIQNDGDSLGLVILLKTRSRLSHLITEGIVNAFIKTVLSWFSNIYNDRQ